MEVISKKKYFKLFILSFILCSSVFAQEGLRPLTGNINYLYGDLRLPAVKSLHQNHNKSAVSLQIPFKDDFSYAPTQSYPNQALWSDSTTYVNCGYGKAPLSIGVATFDGLNKWGYPYQPNLLNMNSSLPADTLTSKPINLFTAGSQTLLPSDSVALTFYYQARGYGESPELTDTIILDFYKPAQNAWEHNVWYQRGNSSPNTNDSVFKRGFVWVSDTAYLHDGFKFRFRNKATTAGDFDHWNLDYIYLDKGRSIIADTSYDDIAFGYIPKPFLQNYSSMPWNQYIASEKDSTGSVFIRSNRAPSFVATNMTYEYLFYNNLGAQSYSYTGGAFNDLKPFKYKGWDSLSKHRMPDFKYNFAPFTDSADFKFKHYIFLSNSSAGTDFIRENDTVIQYQRFRNYYAFDDGSAEGGYYVLGQGGKMAQKITVNVTDTLRALRIYFDPVGSIATATTSYKFRINVWSDGLGAPGTALYTDSIKYPKYYTNSGFNATPEYTLTTPMLLNPGTYYIGIQQFVATGITVGFDKNQNHSSNLYFDSGNGWTQSSIYGSLMMRPVMGKKIIPVGINENTITKASWFSIYPNPSNDAVNVRLAQNEQGSYQITNSIGQVVAEGIIDAKETSVNTNELNSGLYFITVKANKSAQTQKLIIRH